MHKACPQVEETIKWGVPHFEYKGVIAGMAAFKQHAAFGFWKRRLMSDPTGFFAKGESGMGGRKSAPRTSCLPMPSCCAWSARPSR